MRSLTILFALLTLLLFSCQSENQPEFPDDVVLAEMLKSNPDSLANLLEDRIDPFLLPDSSRADYGWWLAKAHNRQRRSLVNDSLIHFSLAYYKENNSPRLLETYLLAAEQMNWAGIRPEYKEKLLEEALEKAERDRDTSKIESICKSLARFYTMPKDKEKIYNLVKITKKYAGKEWSLDTYLNLTGYFFILNESDSIAKYALPGSILARKLGTKTEYGLTRFYIESLNNSGRSKEALEILKDLDSRGGRKGNPLDLNYISTYIGLGQYDLARMHVDSLNSLIDKLKYRAPEETNIIEMTVKILEMIIKTKEGKNFSLNDMGMPADNILKNNRITIKTASERQYIQNKLVKQKLMLDIERGKLRQRLLWGGIIVLIIITVLIVLYQSRLLKKERSFKQIKEQLRLNALQLSENESIIQDNIDLIKNLSEQLDEDGELRGEIEQLIKENDKLKENNKTLLKDIETYNQSIKDKDQEFDTYEKITLQNAKLHERERFLTTQLISQTEILGNLSKKPRYVDDLVWPEILQQVNRLFDGFSYRLHSTYPILTDEDIRYCCLLKLRLSTSVIGILMGISPSSVTKRKQRIKEKMYQQHPDQFPKDQALEIYLWNY